MGNLAALWEVSKGARDRYLSDRRLFRCSSSEGREPKFSILETLHNKSVVRPVIMEMAEKRVAGSACCLPLIPQVQVEIKKLHQTLANGEHKPAKDVSKDAWLCRGFGLLVRRKVVKGKWTMNEEFNDLMKILATVFYLDEEILQMKKPKRMLSTESLSSTGTASTDEDADVVSLSDAELLEGQVELDEQQVDAMITRAASTKESGPAVKVEVEEIMDSPVKGPRPKTTFTELAEPKIDPSRLASLRANLARAKQELGRRLNMAAGGLIFDGLTKRGSGSSPGALGDADETQQVEPDVMEGIANEFRATAVAAWDGEEIAEESKDVAITGHVPDDDAEASAKHGKKKNKKKKALRANTKANKGKAKAKAKAHALASDAGSGDEAAEAEDEPEEPVKTKGRGRGRGRGRGVLKRPAAKSAVPEPNDMSGQIEEMEEPEEEEPEPVKPAPVRPTKRSKHSRKGKGRTEEDESASADNDKTAPKAHMEKLERAGKPKGKVSKPRPVHPDDIDNPVLQLATFAGRREPKPPAVAEKWRCIRDAFNEIVKPALTVSPSKSQVQRNGLAQVLIACVALLAFSTNVVTLDEVYECVELFAGRAIVSTAMKAIGIPAAALDICMADRFPAMDLTTASGMALLDQDGAPTFARLITRSGGFIGGWDAWHDADMSSVLQYLIGNRKQSLTESPAKRRTQQDEGGTGDESHEPKSSNAELEQLRKANSQLLERLEALEKGDAKADANAFKTPPSKKNSRGSPPATSSTRASEKDKSGETGEHEDSSEESDLTEVLFMKIVCKTKEKLNRHSTRLRRQWHTKESMSTKLGWSK
ncbi:unnamed protein product [Symbiodinium microadriaticum]|nr:unnamed protein product [Symbiodinium microadriaticum]